MIRIRLINEGRVVKQITSRLHEGVVLEQIKKYKDPYDTIQIVEGDLSEDAKSMLQHVARKIVPAAMAAGVALSGASSAQAQGGANPNYPGLNHSVGQHMADIFSPNYKEAMRQREYNRSTERQVWNAEQNEIRKQRMADARARAGGGDVQKHVIYDQSRLSKDGKSYIVYGIDNTVRRIPVAGTEYMAGDSQRLPHYITSGGSVLYVRHPHAVTEGAELKQAKRKYNQAAKDANADQVGAGKKIDTMKKSLRQKDVDNKKEVTEGEEDAFMSKLSGLKSWQVVIMNNYYRGKYSDYSGRYYYVLASSADEARQVVLDNADAILQDLLSMKSQNGKKILPRGSAVRITADRIGKIEDGTVAGRMTTAAYKKMFGPQGVMMVKLANGEVVDVQEQVTEADPHKFDSDVDYYAAQNAPAKARSHAKQSPGVNPDDEDYFREIFRKKREAAKKAEQDKEQGVAEGYTVTRGIDKERYQERPGLEGPFSTRSGKVVYYDPKEGKYYDPETDFYIGHEDYAKMDEGVADSLPLNDALKVLRQYGAENLKTTTNELHFYKNGKAFSVPLTFNDDATRSVPLSSLNSATRGLKGQGVAESDPNATVGTIPSTGTSGGTGRTQFAPTGKTTNAKFNKNGQIELDTEQEDDGSVNLDADAVKQLQQAGVQIKEGEDSPVAGAIARRIMTQRTDLLQQYGPVLVTQAIDEVADFVGDVEEIGSSDVSGWVKHVEQMLRDNQPEAFGETVNEGSDTLEGILSKYSADYAKFKAGGDIDENQDFFDALYAHYSDSGEMPYEIAKGRNGDPYEWITARLDNESGVSPVAEAEEDEATPGEQASADQNIIMQIRKASDYEKPTRIELADGSESVIAPNIAKQLLAKFDKMKPESKALLQDTLNTEEGFKEIIAYFGGGVREQAAARAGNIMQSAMAEAGYGRYDRRDAYQRDYDSSVAGMGKRQSYAYQQDGGANDEGWDRPEYQAPQETYYIRFKDTGKVYKQKGVAKSFANKAAANGYALAMIKNNPALQGNVLLSVSSEDKAV